MFGSLIWRHYESFKSASLVAFNISSFLSKKRVPKFSLLGFGIFNKNLGNSLLECDVIDTSSPFASILVILPASESESLVKAFKIIDSIGMDFGDSSDKSIGWNTSGFCCGVGVSESVGSIGYGISDAFCFAASIDGATDSCDVGASEFVGSIGYDFANSFCLAVSIVGATDFNDSTEPGSVVGSASFKGIAGTIIC